MRKSTTSARTMKNRSPGTPKPFFQSVQFPTPIITSNTLYQVESPIISLCFLEAFLFCFVFCDLAFHASEWVVISSWSRILCILHVKQSNIHCGVFKDRPGRTNSFYCVQRSKARIVWLLKNCNHLDLSKKEDEEFSGDGTNVAARLLNISPGITAP